MVWRSGRLPMHWFLHGQSIVHHMLHPAIPEQKYYDSSELSILLEPHAEVRESQLATCALSNNSGKTCFQAKEYQAGVDRSGDQAEYVGSY
ncbi:hypothetical protein TNCV_2442261 [Trichonephila clavipes]|nr:hypothetical protein TNCV_2442261 [Trichonephila clavipes]